MTSQKHDAVLRSLDGVRRKAKFLSVAFGVGVVVAAVVALLLATVLLDYLLNLPGTGPRFVVILAALGGLGYVLYQWMIRPALAKLSIGDIAGAVEQTFPQFDDRLRSTVDFVRSDQPGSDMMKQRVVGEAATLAQSVDLNKVIVTRPVWYSAGVGAAAVGLLVLLALVVSPQYSKIAMSRLFNPFSNQAWPKRVHIDLLSETPQRIPVGQRIDVKMKLSKGDKASMKPIVFYSYDNGPAQKEYMNRNEDGTFSASLDAKADASHPTGKLKVWMEAGDDREDLKEITIVPRLVISRVEAIVKPPAYANMSESTVNLSEGPAVMTIGADVALKIYFNKDLAGGSAIELLPVTAETKLPTIQWKNASPSTAVGQFNARESLRFKVRATDSDNFQNAALEEFELVVRPDQTPTVQIESPRRNEECTPDAYVPLQAVAEDDYGIKTATLLVERLGDKKHWEIPLVQESAAADQVTWAKVEGSADRQRYRANYQWELARDLKEANLKPGDMLEYCVQVQDNFELDGKYHEPVSSGKLRVTIISQEALIEQIMQDAQNAAAQVTQVKNTQDTTKSATDDLKKDTGKKPEFSKDDKKVAETLANQQATAASTAKQIASKLDAVQDRMDQNRSKEDGLKKTLGEVSDKLNETAENPMKDAANKINEAKDAKNDSKASPEQQKKNTDDRNEAMKNASENQQKASDELGKLGEKMNQFGGLSPMIKRIEKMKEDQQKISEETKKLGKDHIGEKPEDIAKNKPQDAKDMQKNADAQQKLSEQIAKATDDMQKASENTKKSDPSASEAMSKAAKTSKSQQVASNAASAAKSASENKQASAQQSQSQVELGLEKMLSELREAERRKLEELQKQLAEMQEQIAQLIKRQATHNFDNLHLQGGEAMKKLTADEFKQLVKLAKLDETDPKPTATDLGGITVGQELTQKNTQDNVAAAQKIESGGAEIAAALTKASGKMERAIVALRDNKLADAYAPPQVEALLALLDAKEKVDKQADDANDKAENAKKDAIRARYEKILAEQLKGVNEETVGMDKRRTPEGIARTDLNKVKEVTQKQGALSKDTKDIEKDLSTLGSVVYLEANKDVVELMDNSTEKLAKTDTGKKTQITQVAIADQLKDMIDSLKETPPRKSKFDQRGGAGGGGGASPPPHMPTEAELRLLKALQARVNNGTKAAAADAAKDKGEITNLGGKQGKIRNMLGQMMERAGGKLGPEPDNRDLLPEETTKEAIENQELEKGLLEDQKPEADKGEKEANLVGDRMGRSRQRLALNTDPGKTTQMIQDKIIADLNDLIQQAQQQQSQGSPKPQPGDKKPGEPKPGEGQPDAEGKPGQGKPTPGQAKANTAKTPAPNTTLGGGGDTNADLHQTIAESLKIWGLTTPRDRQAMLEGAGDQPVEKYKDMIDKYYKAMATKASEK
jgi:hypothetical protein